MLVPPIYSKKANHCHHTNDKCTEMNNIEKENIVEGTGGLPLCFSCKKLHYEKK